MNMFDKNYVGYLNVNRRDVHKLFMSHDGKMYFPDRTWKGVKRGFITEINVSWDKTTYAFIKGKNITGRFLTVEKEKEIMSGIISEAIGNGESIRNLSASKYEVYGNHVLIVEYEEGNNTHLLLYLGADCIRSAVYICGTEVFFDREIRECIELRNSIRSNKPGEREHILTLSVFDHEIADCVVANMYRFEDKVDEELGIIRAVSNEFGNLKWLQFVTIVDNRLFVVKTPDLVSHYFFTKDATTGRLILNNCLGELGYSTTQLAAKMGVGLTNQTKVKVYSKQDVENIARKYKVAYGVVDAEYGGSEAEPGALISKEFSIYGMSERLVLYNAETISKEILADKSLEKKVIDSQEEFSRLKEKAAKATDARCLNTYICFNKLVNQFKGYSDVSKENMLVRKRK